MIYVVYVCFILLFWENLAILQKEDPTIKDLEFVENLKQSLRRNNDDYLEIIGQRESQNNSITKKSMYIAHNTTTSSKLQTHIYIQSSPSKASLPSVKTRRNNDEFDVRDKVIDKIRRRVNDAFASKDSIDKKNNPQRRSAFILNRHPDNKYNVMNSLNSILAKKMHLKQVLINQKNYNKSPSSTKILASKSNIASTSASVTVTPTVTMKIVTVKEPIQRVKLKKLEKFKKFVKKNKGLLKEFISSKRAIQTPGVPRGPSLFTLRGNFIREKNMSDLQHIIEETTNGLRGSAQLPNAQVLDMSPAKGGRVHRMRLRNRLCHRHVLVPEGPKYNSVGRAYLPPHADVRAREYNVTRAPRLLLPRCCNCCRKSVLGCE